LARLALDLPFYACLALARYLPSHLLSV